MTSFILATLALFALLVASIWAIRSWLRDTGPEINNFGCDGTGKHWDTSTDTNDLRAIVSEPYEWTMERKHTFETRSLLGDPGIDLAKEVQENCKHRYAMATGTIDDIKTICVYSHKELAPRFQKVTDNAPQLGFHVNTLFPPGSQN
jgi:hypothetical protein